MSETTALTIAAFAMPEAELIQVLQASLFPNAKPDSVRMVLGYCKAARLDPMMKPVHIVPMSVKTGKKTDDNKDMYEDRDVIMPGVGLYRSKAMDTGSFAGMTEPEFGPMKTLTFSEDKWKDGKRDGTREGTIEYPEWCKITVTRLVQGREAKFTAIEYWTENYATANKYTTAPNAMWKKRARGQLAKCAEAQALRKAFSDTTGNAPTAEEMEGKSVDVDDLQVVGGATTAKVPQPTSKAADAAAKGVIDVDTTTGEATKPNGNGHANGEGESPPARDSMLKLIRAKLDAAKAGKDEKDAASFEESVFSAAGVTKLDGITVLQGNKILAQI